MSRMSPLDRESVEHRRCWLVGLERDDWSIRGTALNDSRCCLGKGGGTASDGNALALEVEKFGISSRGNEDGVAIGCDVDASLNGWLVRGDVNGGLCERGTCEYGQEGECECGPTETA
jgi:hypothetical protein